MDNGTEVKPFYTVPENLIGVDENYLSQLMAEAEKLGSSFPLCAELLAKGMLKLTESCASPQGYWRLGRSPLLWLVSPSR